MHNTPKTGNQGRKNPNHPSEVKIVGNISNRSWISKQIVIMESIYSGSNPIFLPENFGIFSRNLSIPFTFKILH